MSKKNYIDIDFTKNSSKNISIFHNIAPIDMEPFVIGDELVRRGSKIRKLKDIISNDGLKPANSLPKNDTLTFNADIHLERDAKIYFSGPNPYHLGKMEAILLEMDIKNCLSFLDSKSFFCIDPVTFSLSGLLDSEFLKCESCIEAYNKTVLTITEGIAVLESVLENEFDMYYENTNQILLKNYICKEIIQSTPAINEFSDLKLEFCIEPFKLSNVSEFVKFHFINYSEESFNIAKKYIDYESVGLAEDQLIFHESKSQFINYSKSIYTNIY